MGQFQSSIVRKRSRQVLQESFPDLDSLPPEVAVTVLSHLNATDLCLAACVWEHLAMAQVRTSEFWELYM